MCTVFTIVGVMIGIWLLSRISRRIFLFWTFYGKAAILGVMTIWQGMPGPVALVLLAALTLTPAIAVTTEWAHPPELFPTEPQASGVGLTVAVSRIDTAGGTFLPPIVSEHFGVFASLGGCIGALLFGGIACHLRAPETPSIVRADAPTIDGVPVPAAALRPQSGLVCGRYTSALQGAARNPWRNRCGRTSPRSRKGLTVNVLRGRKSPDFSGLKATGFSQCLP